MELQKFEKVYIIITAFGYIISNASVIKGIHVEVDQISSPPSRPHSVATLSCDISGPLDDIVFYGWVDMVTTKMIYLMNMNGTSETQSPIITSMNDVTHNNIYNEVQIEASIESKNTYKCLVVKSDHSLFGKEKEIHFKEADMEIIIGEERLCDNFGKSKCNWDESFEGQCHKVTGHLQYCKSDVELNMYVMKSSGVYTSFDTERSVSPFGQGHYRGTVTARECVHLTDGDTIYFHVREGHDVYALKYPTSDPSLDSWSSKVDEYKFPFIVVCAVLAGISIAIVALLMIRKKLTSGKQSRQQKKLKTTELEIKQNRVAFH